MQTRLERKKKINMSKFIQVYELPEHQQDELWIHSKCPNCGATIQDKGMTVDDAYWRCDRCDRVYLVE